MKSRKALFVGLRSNTTRLQVSNDRLSIELLDSHAKVVHEARNLILPKGEMARADT